MINTENFMPIDENAILKEVWNIEDIGAKTELNDEQIHAVNKLLSMSRILGNPFLHENINTFMILQKSRNRKSMSEFVDVVKKKYNDIFNNDDIKNKLTG